MQPLTTVFKYFFKPKNTAGFTLLEIMVSVSILALVFVSFFKMQSKTIDLAVAAKFHSTAPFLAGKLLAEIEQDLGDWSEPAGDFGENYPGYTWSCQITDAAFEDLDFMDEESHKNFKKIDLEISGEKGEKAYKITTWRLTFE